MRPLALLLLVTGCTGAIGGADDPLAEPGQPSPPPTVATPAEPRSLPLRPLTAFELAQTISDLWGDRASEVAALSPSRLKAPAETMVSPETIWSGARADLLEDALYRVATRIAPKLSGTPAEIFARELPRAFRRPDADAARYLDLFTRLEPKLGRDDALARAFEAALLSPEFLYLTAIGDGSELTSLELASRLSYFIWASAPDAALLAADLRSDAIIERETRRMLLDPRAARGIARFVRNWTGAINLASVNRAAAEWTAELASDALTETDRYVESWFVGDRRAFDALIVGDSTFVSPRLAAFYGVESTGDGFMRVALPKERVGLFTQASFLATHATESASSPTYRGKWFMERALCQGIGTPPPDAQAMAPKFEADMQTRDWHEALQKTKGCASCHSLMEPPGYVYEGFDAVGRARATEKGRPVRTDAVLLTGTDMDATYAGPRDFALAAGKSPTVRTCFASHFLTYAFGRSADEGDRALAEKAGAALATDVREAIVAITTSKSFRRTAQ
jgi:hypothetical protein